MRLLLHTESQRAFALTILKPEMEAIGLQDVHYNPVNGYLIGTLPANNPTLTRKIGFIAHMDTADFNAEMLIRRLLTIIKEGTLHLAVLIISWIQKHFQILIIISVKH